MTPKRTTHRRKQVKSWRRKRTVEHLSPEKIRLNNIKAPKRIILNFYDDLRHYFNYTLCLFYRLKYHLTFAMFNIFYFMFNFIIMSN